MSAPVGRWRIVASRQRGIRSRVGPATTLIGAAITCVAARWAAASVATVTEGGSFRTGSATGARENDPRAETSTARVAARSSTRPVEPGAIVDVQAAPDELRLTMRRVDAAREQSQLVVHAGLVRAHARGEVLREELEPEPLVAAHEPEAAALSLGVRDRRLPVDRDPEAPRSQAKLLPAGREGDGDVRQPRRAALEQLPGGLRRHAADVDPGDVGALRELVRRAGEDEAEADRQQTAEQGRDPEPGPEARAR